MSTKTKNFYSVIHHSNASNNINNLLLETLEIIVRSASTLHIKYAEFDMNNFISDNEDNIQISGYSLKLTHDPQNIKMAGIEYWQGKFTKGNKSMNVMVQLTHHDLGDY